jgi:hypothetical protein
MQLDNGVGSRQPTFGGSTGLILRRVVNSWFAYPAPLMQLSRRGTNCAEAGVPRFRARGSAAPRNDPEFCVGRN